MLTGVALSGCRRRTQPGHCCGGLQCTSQVPDVYWNRSSSTKPEAGKCTHAPSARDGG